MSPARSVANLTLVVASLLTAFLLLEAGIRVIESSHPQPASTADSMRAPGGAPGETPSITPVYVPSDSLGWTLKPSSVQRFRRGFDTIVRSNRLGFRGPEVEEKPAGVIRYAVLGDSYAFGWGVEEEETYAAQLDTLLNRRAAGGVRYQVVNGALPGFGTYQRLAALERLAPYGLDGVIVEFSASNDVVDDWRAAPYVPDHLGEYQARGTQFTALERFLVHRSRLMAIVWDRAMPLRLWIEARRPVNLMRSSRLWEALLDRIAILELPVIVVLNPSRTQMVDDGGIMCRLAHTGYGLRPNAMIRELIERRRLTWVDGGEVFRGESPSELFLGADVHWTPAGHHRLAEALAAVIAASPPVASAGPAPQESCRARHGLIASPARLRVEEKAGSRGALPGSIRRRPLGSRPVVGHVALDHGTGVRILAPQPNSSPSEALGRRNESGPRNRRL